MDKIAIILVAGGEKQNQCFWPSYNRAEAGTRHDLIVVHRNGLYLPKIDDKAERDHLILENKIFEEGELPNKAFGAYRYYFYKYQEDYDYFAFISDDVVIKSNGWLKKAIDMLKGYDSLGVVGTQIFNGGSKYPHSSHIRAPIWFGKKSVLSKMKWEFNTDHEGEMNLSEQVMQVGFAIAQVGNKINVAYDSLEPDHITQLLERKLRGEGTLLNPFSKDEDNRINEYLLQCLKKEGDDPSLFINSPYEHIGARHVIRDIEPFDGLVLDKSLQFLSDRDRKYLSSYSYGVNILCPVGP